MTLFQIALLDRATETRLAALSSQIRKAPQRVEDQLVELALRRR